MILRLCVVYYLLVLRAFLFIGFVSLLFLPRDLFCCFVCIISGLLGYVWFDYVVSSVVMLKFYSYLLFLSCDYLLCILFRLFICFLFVVLVDSVGVCLLCLVVLLVFTCLFRFGLETAYAGLDCLVLFDLFCCLLLVCC